MRYLQEAIGTTTRTGPRPYERATTTTPRIHQSRSASAYPFGWETRTDIQLRDGTLWLRVRPGDLLVGDAGTDWWIADGQ